MTDQIEQRLNEIETLGRAVWIIGDTHPELNRLININIPALCKVVRYAVHSMREYSQARDFDTDDEMKEIARILSGEEGQ